MRVDVECGFRFRQRVAYIVTERVPVKIAAAPVEARPEGTRQAAIEAAAVEIQEVELRQVAEPRGYLAAQIVVSFKIGNTRNTIVSQ